MLVVPQLEMKVSKDSAKNLFRIRQRSSFDLAMASTPKDKGDLFTCLRPILRTLRVIGGTPITGLFASDLSSLNFTYLSFASIQSIIVILYLCVYNAIALTSFFLTNAKDAGGIVKNISEFIFAWMGLFLFIFMYKISPKLIVLFYKWRDIKLAFHKEDVNLFRNYTIICSIIFITGLLENIASHLDFYKRAFVDKANATICEIFVYELYPLYKAFMPGNCLIACGLFIGDKWLAFAWNFADVFVILIALAISNRFGAICEVFTEKMQSNIFFTKDGSCWQKLCTDFEILRELLEDIHEIFSPLIFASLFTGTYFISVELNFFLLPNTDDLSRKIYDACAFAQFLLRTFMVITFSGKVYENAHKVGELLSKCPTSQLTKEVERTEFKLGSSTIGLKGLKLFTITNSFILSVVNVVFTMEIVLLQTSAAHSHSNGTH